MSQANPLTSDCYVEFQDELQEVLSYKWTESEKLGRDIGFEKALKQWMEKIRPEWRKKRRHAKD